MNPVKPKSLELNEELAVYLGGGVRHTFQSMIGLSPKSGPFEVRNSIDLQGDISGIISLTQDNLDASCILSFSGPSIFYILSKIYGRQFTSIDDDSVRQGVGEFTNIIFGVIKSGLNDIGYTLKMGLPKVIIGAKHLVLVDSPKSLYIPFDIDGHKFEIMLTLKGE